MSSLLSMTDDGLTWQLVYTKRHAETWVDANLRKQGFETLMPLTRIRSGLSPLFPRYVFAGCGASQRAASLGGTYGVQYIVCCGQKPSIVPPELIAELRARMDDRGIVPVERLADVDPLFARRQRERLHALERLSAAGFKVRIA
jgi:Transcription termination factor nusG